MPVISCTKFGVNQIILTVFSGFGPKSPPYPSAEKNLLNAVGNRVHLIMDAKALRNILILKLEASTNLSRYKVSRPIAAGQLILPDLSEKFFCKSFSMYPAYLWLFKKLLLQ